MYSHKALLRRHDIRLDLISIREPVRAVEDGDHGHQFAKPFVVEAEFFHRGGVRIDAVPAAVRRGDCQRDHFLGQRIELAGSHRRFEPQPGLFQQRRMRGQGLPEVGDEIDVLGLLDVLEDLADQAGGLGFFDYLDGCAARVRCVGHR